MPLAMPLPVMQRRYEAAGMAANRIEDASDGMPRQVDSDGGVWAWNDAMNEWQILHPISSGDTLWKLSAAYYGTPSLDGVRAIHKVPQNYAIQGPSPDTGLIPGDVILIPGLSQFWPAPESPVASVPTTYEVPPSTTAEEPPPPPPPPPPPNISPDDIVLTGAEPTSTTTKKKKGMSTGAKVGLGLGALALVGGGIYFATRKGR